MTPAPPLRLALAAPVFAAPGIPTMRTPSLEAASWPVVRDAVVRAEQLGYDSVWFSDHLFHGREGAFYESWTALCIAAGFTDSIRLVNNHLGNGLRDARMLAKMATSLADASGDRFDLFLARGYREREYRAYGLPWESDSTRTRRLAEAVDVIRTLWSGSSVDFDGEFYRLDGAIAAPTTPAAPFLWLGGPLDAQTENLIATRADGWNSFPLGLAAYGEAAARIDAACTRVGRAPEALRRSLETQVLILDDWSQWPSWLEHWRRLRDETPMDAATSDIAPSPDDLTDERVTAACREQFIVGTRDEVADRIGEYRRLGVTDLVCWFMDAPSDASMTAMADLMWAETSD